MFVTPPAGVVSSLYEMTSGNPYMLAEALSLGSPEHVIEQWSSPPRVRDLARQRSAELGRTTAELLAQASLFETDFSLEVLATRPEPRSEPWRRWWTERSRPTCCNRAHSRHTDSRTSCSATHSSRT